MFGSTRWSPFEDMFSLHREVDRLFNQAWSDLPTRAARPVSPSFQIRNAGDAWTIEIPLPGIDPAHVTLEVAPHTLNVRVQEPEAEGNRNVQFEQTLTVPRFLDLDRITATHRHGLLVLTLPLRESVKPRRVQIGTAAEDKKQLTAA